MADASSGGVTRGGSVSGAGVGVPAGSNRTPVASTSQAPVNPPPPQAALAVFILREVVAIIFVVGWLGLFALSTVTEEFEVPFWFHIVGVGVLAYALGINVADLTAFRPPMTHPPGGHPVMQVVRAQQEEG